MSEKSSTETKEENEIIPILSKILEGSYRTLSKMVGLKSFSEKAFDGAILNFDPARIEMMKDTNISQYMRIPFCVTLKESPIHEKGVFVIREVLEGSILTFYPGDIIEYYPKKRSSKNEMSTCSYYSFRFETKARANSFEDRDNFDLSSYKYHINEYYSITGHPEFTEERGYLGHFINDSMSCTDIQETIDAYQKHAFDRANCKFVSIANGLHVAVVATRNISKGEELLVNYGVEYWLNQVKRGKRTTYTF